LRLELTVIVEEGALFFDFSRPDPVHRGVYAFAPARALRHQDGALEGTTDKE
jgi:hypothetical protein